MRLRELPRVSDRRRQKIVDTFGGLCRLPDVPLGQWADTQNLSSYRYPRLTVRPKSGTVSTIDGNPTGDVYAICGGDELAVVFRKADGKGKIYAGGFGLTVYADYHDIPVTAKRQIVRMGAWAIMFPDQFYVNVIKLSTLPSGSNPDLALIRDEDYGFISASVEYKQTVNPDESVNTPRVTLTLCDKDRKAISGATPSATAPSTPAEGDLWLDTTDHLLKRYSSEETWATVETLVKIYCTGIGDKFKTGDCVNLSERYLDHADGIWDSTLEDYTAGGESVCKLFDAEGAYEIQGRDTNHILVKGVIDVLTIQVDLLSVGSSSTDPVIKVERECPPMDYVVECGNRLWGCYYGTGEDGELLNELYACALGDFKQWRKYNGLSTASWTASRGKDGPWTGAAVLDNAVLFFKTGSVDKVFPSSSGAHQVLTQDLDGIEDGAWRTACVIDNVLFYKARQGVVRYAGTLPQVISEPLGSARYTALVAARHEEMYVISMRRTSSEAFAWYTYDTVTGIWHCLSDDSGGAGTAVTFKRRMYFIGDSPSLWTLDAGNGAGSAPDGVQWYAETGEIGYRNPFSSSTAFDSPARKYVSRVFVRLGLALNCTATMLISYDGGPWEPIESLTGRQMAPHIEMITPRRCDSFRLRLQGIGACEIQSIAFELQTGGRWH